MAISCKLGILLRSITQAVLLIYLLDIMDLINANYILYLVSSILLFLVRYLMTHQIMKKDMDVFFANVHAFSKITIAKPKFSRQYILIDSDRKIFLKKKNPFLYIIFNNEVFGMIDSEDDSNVEIRTASYYYL